MKRLLKTEKEKHNEKEDEKEDATEEQEKKQVKDVMKSVYTTNGILSTSTSTSSLSCLVSPCLSRAIPSHCIPSCQIVPHQIDDSL